MSLKKLAQGFKSNGASEYRSQTIRVKSRAHTHYKAGPRPRTDHKCMSISSINFNSFMGMKTIFCEANI